MPSGAHYLMVNATAIRFPAHYVSPENLAQKPRDWRLSWMVLQEFGFASIPVSGMLFLLLLLLLLLPFLHLTKQSCPDGLTIMDAISSFFQ